MAMTDRELLELAAKAAGYDVEEHCQERGLWVYFSPGNCGWWNPRDNDGDALRLSNKLDLCLSFYPGYETITVETGDDDIPMISENYDHDDEGSKRAATRRAITRAAAEVGKGMLSHDEFVRMFPGRFEPQ